MAGGSPLALERAQMSLGKRKISRSMAGGSPLALEHDAIQQLLAGYRRSMAGGSPLAFLMIARPLAHFN